MYETLADAVLLLHLVVVLFIVGGPVLVWLGNRRGRWPWVDGLAFRAAHLGAIAYVVGEAWLGIECPLTTLESRLRVQGGGSGYAQTFIGHWVQRLLFYDAPGWVFTLVYSAFGLLVVMLWWRYPVRGRGGQRGPGR